MAKQKPLVIGIAGGSGSGKTTVSKEISKRLPADRVLILTEDAYYNDNSALSMDERKKINYDHPNAYDTDLLIEQLQDLLDGKAIEMPTYNFNILSRAKDTIHVEPADIIILEGILVLASEELRKFMDIKLFVDADDDIRFIRRGGGGIAGRTLVAAGKHGEGQTHGNKQCNKFFHFPFILPFGGMAKLGYAWVI